MFQRDSTAGRGSEVSIRDLLLVLFRRRWVILLFFGGAVAAAGAWAFLTPDAYESHARILVKKARADVPVAAKDSPALVIARVSEAELNTEVEVLKSRWLFEKTVAALEAEEEGLPDPGKPTLLHRLRERLGRESLPYRDLLLLALEEKVRVGLVGNSNLVEVRYRSGDPQWSRRLVDRMTREYVDGRTDVFRTRQTVGFFEDQMAQASERLTAAETKLERFLDGSGITVIESPEAGGPMGAQLNATLERVTELEKLFGDMDASVREARRRVATLTEQLATEPERMQSVDRAHQDTQTEELERALTALRLRRDELAQDFSADSRNMRDLDAQIRATEERLKVAEARVGPLNRTKANPVHARLRDDLLQSRTELEGLTSRRDSARTQLANERARLEGLRHKSFELEDLTLEVATAKEAYLLYRKKHEEARIAAEMDREKIVDVSIAQPANLPLGPVKSQRLVTLLIASALGLFGGLGLAFALEFVDRTFVTGEDIESRLGIPHLGSIPDEPRALLERVGKP